MRIVWPAAVPTDDIDPVAVVARDDRTPPPGRPWVLATMIASADGSATDEGDLSGGLGGAADKAMFAAVRAVADVIVAGATTVIAENYGPSRPSPAVREQRIARGQTPVPRIAVATASLSIDLAHRLFAEASPDARPLVLSESSADRARRRALEAVADVHLAGDGSIDWARALHVLHAEAGASVVLCEGGPRTVGQLVDADLLDELCLTVSATLVGGNGPRLAVGPPPGAHRPLRLARVVVADDDALLLRYVRARPGPGTD